MYKIRNKVRPLKPVQTIYVIPSFSTLECKSNCNPFFLVVVKTKLSFDSLLICDIFLKLLFLPCDHEGLSYLWDSITKDYVIQINLYNPYPAFL